MILAKEFLARAMQKFSERRLCCIDERTPWGALHMAGSGILRGLAQAARISLKAKVDIVTSHANCGAAGLWAKNAGFDPADGDQHGQEFSQKLAKKLGAGYDHIDFSQLAGPADRHISRVIYYVGAPYFDQTRADGLPAGFTISRFWSGKKDAVEEVKIAISIVLGEHGLGQKITASDPLVLCAINVPSDELKPLAEGYNGRVVVENY